ncbi:peptidase M4 [Thalassotalea euphylliae]|uniref:Peptidase M4 n=1 Tax=Thalassotalea euphylliae TaxID=1655234 RepID=A0A3E0TP33_9GAMM|nr:PepSY domain-containing protein [Thalassotalea euphylliae]REL26284.1 peptidase M4 [Thalassotalea euphylliae]
MTRLALLVISLCLLLAAAPAVVAQPYYDKQTDKQAGQARAKGISASQAAQKVQSRYGGKVLKVQRSGNGYRVKLIKKDGRIVSVFVDGSGRIKG